MITKPGTLPNANSRNLGSFMRFLLSGGFNTAVTYALYLLLIEFFSFRLSYSIAFVVGIGLAYVLNRFFVFRVFGGLRALTLTPLVYLVQYLVGIVTVSVWVESLGWSVRIAPIAAIVLTIPLTFILSQWIFSRNH